MSPPTCQTSWRLTPLRFDLWQRHTTRRSRLPRGHQSHPKPHAGKSVWRGFTLSSPSRTALLQASLPTPTTATSTSSSLIPRLPAAELPAVSISASSPRCVPLVRLASPPTSALRPGPSSTATASNSTPKSASNAVALARQQRNPDSPSGSAPGSAAERPTR